MSEHKDVKRFRIGGAAGLSVVALGLREDAITEIRLEDAEGKVLWSADPDELRDPPKLTEELATFAERADVKDLEHIRGLVGLAWTRRAMPQHSSWKSWRQS